jgi:hypothetical protein
LKNKLAAKNIYLIRGFLMIINDLDYLEKSESAAEITGGAIVASFTVVGGINATAFGGATTGNLFTNSFNFNTGSGFEFGILVDDVLGPVPTPFTYTGGAIAGSFTFSTIP